MSVIHVIKSGMLTTVQDRGRWGYQAMGVPVAGAMDMYSHRLANALVGNDADAAALEITLTGPELEFDDERFEVIRRLLSRAYDEELPLADTIAAAMARETRLRAYEYLPRTCGAPRRGRRFRRRPS